MAERIDTASRLDTGRPADLSVSVPAATATAGFAFNDAGAGYPKHAAQQVELHNESAANATASLRDEKGRTITVVLAGGETRLVNTPVATIHVDTEDNISAIGYYWLTPGTPLYK